jgi:hypothetical protein
MCLSCGCGEPNEDHGDPRNITMQKLEEAAQAGETTPEQAAQNIVEGLGSSGSGTSQQRYYDKSIGRMIDHASDRLRPLQRRACSQ